MDAVGVLRKTLVANLPVSEYVLDHTEDVLYPDAVLESILFLSFSSSVSFLFLVDLLFVLSEAMGALPLISSVLPM